MGNQAAVPQDVIEDPVETESLLSSKPIGKASAAAPAAGSGQEPAQSGWARWFYRGPEPEQPKSWFTTSWGFDNDSCGCCGLSLSKTQRLYGFVICLDRKSVV